MPGVTTNDNVQQTKDEKPKSSEQIDLDDAETALNGKDYKTAQGLLEKLGKEKKIRLFLLFLIDKYSFLFK